MDSMNLSPEEFYYGLKEIKKIIDFLPEIEKSVISLKSSASINNIDSHDIENLNGILFNDISELYTRLEKIKSIMIMMDSRIYDLYNKLDKNNIIINDDILENEEDNLDRLKLGSGDAICDKSDDTSSILDILKTKDGVNLVLDSLKNTNDERSYTHSDVTSILNKEM